LTVDGQDLVQKFDVLPDPRLTTTAAEWAAQREFQLEVLDLLGQVNHALDRIDGLRIDLQRWRERSDGAAHSSAVTAISMALGEIRSELIDVNMRGAQLWPSGLHEKLNALFDSADGADYAPTRQAREVLQMYREQFAGIEGRLQGLVANEIADLNRQIAGSALPALHLAP
jgi:hypothetical protein